MRSIGIDIVTALEVPAPPGPLPSRPTSSASTAGIWSSPSSGPTTTRRPRSGDRRDHHPRRQLGSGVRNRSQPPAALTSTNTHRASAPHHHPQQTQPHPTHNTKPQLTHTDLPAETLHPASQQTCNTPGQPPPHTPTNPPPSIRGRVRLGAARGSAGQEPERSTDGARCVRWPSSCRRRRTDRRSRSSGLSDLQRVVPRGGMGAVGHNAEVVGELIGSLSPPRLLHRAAPGWPGPSRSGGRQACPG